MSALPHSYDLVSAVLAEVQALRAEVKELREALARPAEKDERSEALLESINLEIGDLEFSCASLLEHAQLDVAAELRAALGSFFAQGVNPRRLGKWLAKMHKRGTVGRYVVEHQQAAGHRGGTWVVRIWRI